MRPSAGLPMRIPRCCMATAQSSPPEFPFGSVDALLQELRTIAAEHTGSEQPALADVDVKFKVCIEDYVLHSHFICLIAHPLVLCTVCTRMRVFAGRHHRCCVSA